LTSIVRELGISNNKLVKIVTEEVGTGVTSMTVENAEEGTFWPVIAFLVRRFHNVQNDGYSILIVVSDDALVSVCCISRDDAILAD
jgi:uncharacterized membrane protein YhaH (DUF805 family)